MCVYVYIYNYILYVHMHIYIYTYIHAQMFMATAPVRACAFFYTFGMRSSTFYILAVTLPFPQALHILCPNRSLSLRVKRTIILKSVNV